MTEISNGIIIAKINEFGAELKSLTYCGKEYIWQGDPEVWAGSSPILFPICSGLRDDEYEYNGKYYKMPKHGFAKNMLFEIESKSQDTATFLLCSNAETKKCYPFDFELRIIFTVVDKKLIVKYDIKNLSADTMYFSIGGHDGYSCPEGLEKYDIIFPQTETLYSSIYENGAIGDKKTLIIENDSKIELKNEHFTVDAIILESFKSKSLILKKRDGENMVKVTFDGFPYLLIWSVPNAKYVCVEPWCGICDKEGTSKSIKTKEGILKAEPQQSVEKIHTIEIL